MGTEIAFLTLFLGLVHGARPVALSAGPGVAAIELVLDGKSVARIAHPPWQADVDLGAALLPHHLEARGLAADGSQVAHTGQWINLPRPLGAAQILLEGDAGEVRTAHVVATSFTGQQPTEIHLTIDDAPVALDAEGRAKVRLPAVGAAHVLAARVLFPGDVEARKELVLTSDDASGVASELTAVPVRTPRQERPRRPDSLRGRFAAAGQPLEIATVQQEAPHVFIVRSPGFAQEFVMALNQIRRLGLWHTPDFNRPFLFHYVSPAARVYKSPDGLAEIFDMTKGFPFAKPFYEMTLLPDMKPGPTGPPRLADAVAAAGVHALGYQTARAVLLLLGADATTDHSDFAPELVRAYLKATGVPLFVWTPGDPSRFAAWGDVTQVNRPESLRSAEQRLTDDVDTQQVVWVRGRYLPQDITLAPAAGHPNDLSLLFGSPERAP